MLRRILKGIKKHNSLLPRPPPPLDRQKSLIKYHFNHNSDYCERIDEYAYLSSVSRLANDYIKLENEYTESYFHRQQPLIDRLMSELKQWQQTDCGEYLTGERGKDGRYYFQSDGVYFSAADNRGTIGKRVLLDTRKLSNYCYGALISPDCRLLAFIEQDCSGADESGTLRVKDLTSDKILADRIPGVVSFVWHQSRDYSTNNNDNYRLLYTTVNRQLRTDRVLLHTVSSSPHNDQLIFTEPDERFFVDLNLTKDGKFALITCSSRSTSEVHFLPMQSFENENIIESPRLFSKRQKGVQYFVDHHNGQFIIVSNLWDRQRFELASVPATNDYTIADSSQWKRIAIAASNDFHLEDVDLFRNEMVLYGRNERGLPAIRVYNPHASTQIRSVRLPTEICSIQPGVNRDFDAPGFRFIAHEFGFRERLMSFRFSDSKLSDERAVRVARINQGEYLVDRVMAGDCPLTIIAKPRAISARKTPLNILLTSYGSYGINNEPPFDCAYLPLLERGWVVVSSHIRGGSELGRQWYEQGRGRLKHQAINDLHACINWLRQPEFPLKYNFNAKSQRISGLGVSAGGLLVASALPQWHSCVLHVPFVDPLSAMLDRGNPLTTVEYEEWGGDPLADRDSFLYLQQLSPYDQLLKLHNTTGGVLPPSIYMTAGRLDRRVAYWQPLKYAARLRNAFSDYRNGGGDGRKLLLTVREDGGHFGDTTEAGEEETARWLAFLILQS